MLTKKFYEKIKEHTDESILGAYTSMVMTNPPKDFEEWEKHHEIINGVRQEILRRMGNEK